MAFAMASVKMVNTLALAAFAPEAPYLAAGTMAGAVDLSFSSTANLDIFQLDFSSDYRQLVLAGSVASPEQFTRLSWGESPANSEQLPLGTIAAGLVDGNIGLWNPTLLISSIANREGGEVTENAFLGHLSKHSGPVSTKVCLLQTSFWACGVPLGCKLSLNQNLVFLLQSCKETSEISQIHGLMIKSGLDLVPFTLSKLLANSIHHTSYAAKIFKYIESPNLYMFNTMLRSYSISDDPIQALVLLNRMRAQSLMLDQFTFVSALKSCARASEIWTGLGVHSVLLINGFVMFLNVMNSLLHFYCACGCVGDAHKLFDEFLVERDLVSWNTLMGGYLRVHKYSLVVDLFKQLHRDGIEVSVTTILGILSAVGELKGRDLGGEFIHGYCIKFGLSMNLNVTSALISMYGKTGEIGSGHKVFDEADAKDVVLWNCLIDRYAKSGMLEEAFRLLRLMKVQGLKPNSSTFVGLLSVSAAFGGLSVGQCVHDYIKQQQLVIDAILGTALINMYTKCGLLKEAIEVFDNVDRKDLMCWTAMISAYGVHGQAENAFVLFQRMEEEGCRPNEVTFLAVLNACSHNGLIGEGKSCFRRMVERYSLCPKVEHYGCVIDLLGRAGLLEEAMKLIKSLPIEEDATAWRALLAACRVYGNISLGEQVKRELEQRFDEHPADALTLTSTYAIAGRMEDRASMLEKNEGKQIEEWKYSPIGKKEVGFSRVAA